MSTVIGLIGGAAAVILFQLVFPATEAKLIEDLKDKIAQLEAKIRALQGKS